MSIAGVVGPAASALRGRVKDTGLPVEVHLGSMVIRRNETGQVWIQSTGSLASEGGNLSTRTEHYLFAKATGRWDWSTEDERHEGVSAGVDRLLAEVLQLEVRIP